MAEQYFGEWSRLVPALEVGGVEYGLVIRWSGGPEAPATAIEVVSGQVSSVTTPVAGQVRVVCARANQRDSYTLVNGPGDSLEVEFPVLMGGNVAATHEAQRVYSWANDAAYRGDDAAVRAVPGDVVVIDGRAWMILEATAFGQAPASVAWQGSESLPTVSRVTAEPNALTLTAPDAVGVNAGARVLFVEGEAGVFADGGLYVGDASVPSYTEATREVWARPGDSVDDPEYLPDDAAFSGDPSYWWDQAALSFRVSSGSESDGEDWLAIYYLRGEEEWTNAAGTVVVLEGGQGAGYGGASDAVTVASCITRDDFQQSFLVLLGGDNVFGEGAVEWRIGSASDAVCVAMAWTNGTITDVRARTTSGGTMASVAFTANGTAFTGASFAVRVTKLGEDLTMEWSQDGSTWTTAATVTLTGIEDEETGLLGIAAWDGHLVRVTGWFTDAVVRLVDLEDGGEAYRETFETWEAVGYTQEVTLPAATALTSVELALTRADGSVDLVAMTESATPARDHYAVSGGVLTLYSETAGDSVRVVQAAAVGAPSTPGRPPRVPGTVNFATESGTPGVATSDVSENVGNWSDVLVLADPHGEWTATGGEEFVVRRAAVFNPTAPPTFTFDLRGSAGTTWGATPAPEDLLHRPAEGLTLVRQSWLTALGSSAELCVRAEGFGLSQAGRMTARQWNDLAAALAAFEEGWIQLAPSGTADTTSVLTSIQEPGVTGWACVVGSGSSNVWVPTGFAWGIERREVTDLPASLPYWFVSGGPVYQDDSRDRVQYVDGDHDGSVECLAVPESPAATYDERDLIRAADCRVDASPFGGLGSYARPSWWSTLTSSNYFGGAPVLGPSLDLQGRFAAAQVTGTAIGVPDVLRRVPAGTTVLEAWVRVRFEGLEVRTWSAEFEVSADDASSVIRYVENGVTVRERIIVDGVTVVDDSETPPAAATTGGVGFRLVGKRQRSENVALADGSIRTVEASEFRAFGGSIGTGSVTSGAWAVIDATALVQALIDARGSLYTEFQLWPTVGGVGAGDEAGELAAYGLGLLPTGSASFSLGSMPGTWGRSFSAAGTWVQFGTLTLGTIMARLRLPDGLDTPPVLWPAMIADA